MINAIVSFNKRYPLLFSLLRITLAVGITLFIASAYILYKNNQVEETIPPLTREMYNVDKALKQRKQIMTALQRHQALSEVIQQIDAHNSQHRALTQSILDLNKTDNALVSVTSEKPELLKVVAKIDNRNNFYIFCEKIENMPVVDRITLEISPQNIATLSIYTAVGNKVEE